MASLSSVILRFFLFFCAFLLIFPVTGGAQEQTRARSVFDMLSNPMPDIKLMPEAEFVAKTDLYEEVPFDDPLLAYRVRLPKGWTKKRTVEVDTMSVSQDVLGEIASYVSEARLTEARSELNIQALSLSYDIAASHWFLQHVLSNAYNLEGITEHNDNRVEALYVLVKDDVTYVVRAVAIKSGKRIILAEYLAPQEAWENERVLSTQAMQGFDLLNKDDSYVQALKNFKFLDVAEFSYPERWEIRTPTIRSTDRMEAKILNVNRTMKVLNGQIEVYVVSAAIVDSLEEELLRLKEVLTQKQLDLGELIETHPDFKFDENMKFGIVEAYEANNKDLKLIEYELWIAIMSSDTNYYFIPLLTPRRTEEFTTWSRNIGDFRIVVENMKPIVNKPALEQWQPQGGKTAAGASQ